LLISLLEDYTNIILLNREQAIQGALLAQPLDLILLDVNKPGLDGYEVWRHLKEHEKPKLLRKYKLSRELGTYQE